MKWLANSDLVGQSNSFNAVRKTQPNRAGHVSTAEQSLFVLRQFESLPKPLSSGEALELLAKLAPPYDLMARWQLYTGLRVSELLKLEAAVISGRPESAIAYRRIDVVRKGRKLGYVIAPESLLGETDNYLGMQRKAWLQRAQRGGKNTDHLSLFINSRGASVAKSTYQRVVSEAGLKCGFNATTHLLRATFACMLLARLEQLASRGAQINPLLIVKILMGHERIDTTDRYLRAIATDSVALEDILETLLSGAQ